jgi:hypothetical protein
MKKATMFFALLAMMFISGTALAQNGRSVRQEICQTVWNPCCNEFVDMCIVSHYVLDENGTPTHFSSQGQGTGENGTNYVFVLSQNQHFNTQWNGASSITVTSTAKFVATGGSNCSYTAHVVQHLTTSASGEVTPGVFEIRIECDNDAEVN